MNMKYMTVQRLKWVAVLIAVGMLAFLVNNSNSKCSLMSLPNSQNASVSEQKIIELRNKVKIQEIGLMTKASDLDQLAKQLKTLQEKNNKYEEEIKQLNERAQSLQKANQHPEIDSLPPRLVTFPSAEDASSSPVGIKYGAFTTSFEDTLRNCLGTFCFDQKPDGSSFDMVGLLAPPHSAGEEILNSISKSGGSVTTSTVHLEFNHHVPAYGYGKNHGWSRIIRLVRQPIPHALAMLRPLVESRDINTAEGKMIFDTQVRQIVRWHCRLSHVAAHTKMLTVFVEDIIQRPYYELEKIITFSGIKMPERPRAIKAGKMLRNLLRAQQYDVHANVSAIVQAIDVDTFRVAVEALEEELVGTGFLTKWPCRSFQKIHAQAAVNARLPVPAKDLAADCSDPRVTCSVGFDRQGG